ncbi:uncharacterized protein LOC141850774 [Brevipalpus obovatus]|uniref:uncharacterized protein LOC141850774 n=1 Tax=Brevipalpus obovatus TaxID=246614 RepID=UPI003D9F8BAF
MNCLLISIIFSLIFSIVSSQKGYEVNPNVQVRYPAFQVRPNYQTYGSSYVPYGSYTPTYTSSYPAYGTGVTSGYDRIVYRAGPYADRYYTSSPTQRRPDTYYSNYGVKTSPIYQEREVYTG